MQRRLDMAIDWVKAGEIAFAAASAYYDYLTGRSEADERERNRT